MPGKGGARQARVSSFFSFIENQPQSGYLTCMESHSGVWTMSSDSFHDHTTREGGRARPLAMTYMVFESRQADDGPEQLTLSNSGL